MTLRVRSGETHVDITLNEDAFAWIDQAGMKIRLESGVGVVTVCELSKEQAQEFAELILTALRTVEKKVEALAPKS